MFVTIRASPLLLKRSCTVPMQSCVETLGVNGTFLIIFSSQTGAEHRYRATLLGEHQSEPFVSMLHSYCVQTVIPHVTHLRVAATTGRSEQLVKPAGRSSPCRLPVS